MNLRPRGRVSRVIAAWLALSIGLASVQIAWAESPERDHDQASVGAVADASASTATLAAEPEPTPDDGCAGLCLCSCQCPHAQPCVAATPASPVASDPPPSGAFPLPDQAHVSVSSVPRLRPPVV